MGRWQDRYDALKTMHRCVVCGENKVDDGYTTCLVCRMDKRERNKGYKLSTEQAYFKRQHQKRRRDILYAFGVCTVCGKRDATPDYHICDVCRGKMRNKYAQKEKEMIPKIIKMDGKHCVRCGSTEVVKGKKMCMKHLEIAQKNAAIARTYITKKEGFYKPFIFGKGYAFRKGGDKRWNLNIAPEMEKETIL